MNGNGAGMTGDGIIAYNDTKLLSCYDKVAAKNAACT